MRNVSRPFSRTALQMASPLLLCALAPAAVQAQAVLTGAPGGALSAGTISTSSGTASDNGPNGVLVAPAGTGVVTVSDAVVNALFVSSTTNGLINVNFTGVNDLRGFYALRINSPGAVAVDTGTGNRFISEGGNTAFELIGLNSLTLVNGQSTIDGRNGGIRAASAGSVAIQNAGAVIGRQGAGIDASGLVQVSINNSGVVTGLSSGTSGIQAISRSISVTNTGAVTGTHNGMLLTASSGSVDVVTSGSVTGTQAAGVRAFGTTRVSIRVIGTVSGGYNGILATTFGTGATVILVEGSVAGTVNGITAQAGTLGADINVTGSVTAVSGGAIDATSASHISLGIGPNGIVAGTAGPGQAVVNLNTAQGSTSRVDVAAGGVLRSTSGSPADAVLKGTGGSFLIDNSGAISGRLDFSALTGTDRVQVNTAANSTFHTGGTSTFSAGDDVFANAGALTTYGAATVLDFRGGANTYINSGAIVVGRGPNGVGATLALSGLTLFDNGGLLEMANGVAGDTIAAAGAIYRGALPARLAVDTFIGGPGSLSDTLVVGSSAGRTSLLLNDVSSHPGALNTVGTVIVAGSTHAGDFVLDPGSSHYNANLFGGAIDKPGLFFSQLAINGSGSTVLISAPKAEAYQLATLGAQAQKIWHDTVTTPERQAYLRQQLRRPESGDSTVTWFDVRSLSSGREDLQELTVLDRAYSYDVGYSQDVQAAIAGFERADSSGWAVGASVGYVTSDADFDRRGTRAELAGPIGDIYATAVSGGTFLAASLRGNFLDVRTGGPQLAGLALKDVRLTSLGGTIEAGLSVPFIYGSQLEPSATLAYASTLVDGVPADSPLRFEDAESLRVAVGVRMSGRSADDTSARYILSARFVDDLSADNAVRLSDSLAIIDGSGGGFGEVRASIRSESRNGLTVFGDAAVQSGSTWASSLTVGVSLRY